MHTPMQGPVPAHGGRGILDVGCEYIRNQDTGVDKIFKKTVRCSFQVESD